MYGAGVSFEIQFGLFIKICAGEHIFYIWQEIIALTLEPRFIFTGLISVLGPFNTF